jgi:hypothetical protein
MSSHIARAQNNINKFKYHKQNAKRKRKVQNMPQVHWNAA